MIVCDLEAGVGTLLRVEPGQLDLVLVVSDPSAKSVDVAVRALRIAEGKAPVIVVANRVRNDDDLAAIRDGVNGHELVVVPEDAAITLADRDGLAPIDVAPDAPGVRELVALAGRIAMR